MSTTTTFSPTLVRDQRLKYAFAEGMVETYLKAYVEVMTQLETEGMEHLLVQVVNRLREVMRDERKDVYTAGTELMQELSSTRSKHFVMAAMVDEALNGGTRLAGKPVVKLLGMRETLG